MHFLLKRYLAQKVQNLLLGDFPRVFGSVSQSRFRLENHGGYSSRLESLMIQMVESQANLITF